MTARTASRRIAGSLANRTLMLRICSLCDDAQKHMSLTEQVQSTEGLARDRVHAQKRSSFRSSLVRQGGRVERTPSVCRSALYSPLLPPFGLGSVTVFDPAPLCASPSQKPACGFPAHYVLKPTFKGLG